MADYRALWAKKTGFGEPYPLAAHLLDTVTVVQVLYDVWLRQGLKDLLSKEFKDPRQCIAYAAGCHDIGKASPVFASQPAGSIEEWGEIRTTLKNAGFTLVEDKAQLWDLTDGDVVFESDARRHERNTALSFNPKIRASASAGSNWVAAVGAGHHGQFVIPARESWSLFSTLYETGGWSQAQKDLQGLVYAACGNPDLPETISPVAVVLVSGLTILADRIASHTDFVETGAELIKQGVTPWDSPEMWVEVRANSADTKVRSTVGVYQGWDTPSVAQESIMGTYTPTDVQVAARDAGEGLTSLMIPTGHGKTEAALLRHAQRGERLMFLLPTVATSNAMMSRILTAYAGTGNLATLAHGNASIEDFYTRSEVTDDSGAGLLPSEFAHHSAVLTAPITVGTVDQILRAALPGKWAHLRLLALANAHVVIDEVHTLDAYQTQLLIQLMSWLRLVGSRVTLLSATLPAQHRDQILSSYGAKAALTSRQTRYFLLY